MNESAMSLMRQLPETKSEINHYSQIIKNNLLDGEVEFIPVFLQIKALSQLFKKLENDILLKDMLLEFAEKHNGKTIELTNAKLTIKEAGVKWNFENCDDFELASINDAILELTAKKKSREIILKAIIPGTEIFGSDGIQLNPAVKTSTTIVSILLK